MTIQKHKWKILPFLLSVMRSLINELYDDNPARSSSGSLVCYSDPISRILTFQLLLFISKPPWKQFLYFSVFNFNTQTTFFIHATSINMFICCLKVIFLLSFVKLNVTSYILWLATGQIQIKGNCILNKRKKQLKKKKTSKFPLHSTTIHKI